MLYNCVAMPTTMTEAQVGALLAEDKVITANLSWRPWGRRGSRLEATVLAKESNIRLKLYGYVGPRQQSFSLLYESIDIRRLCLSNNARHINRDKERFEGVHKHRFDESVAQSREAYRPNGIQQPVSIDDAFFAFLQECKIILQGAYQQHLQLG